MFTKPFFFFSYFSIFFIFNSFFNYFVGYVLEDAIFSESSLLFFWFFVLFTLRYVYYDQIDYNDEQLGENSHDRLNYDLFIRFLKISSEDLWFLNSFIFTEIKKWHLFNKKFKYSFRNKTNKTFIIKNTKNIFLLWRPIFKKWSYLGYYRSNRSKWIK